MMKAWHWGALGVAAAAGGWAFWRVRKADAAGVPWDEALKHWDLPVEQVAVKIATERQNLQTAANGGGRSRPWVLPPTDRAG